ncbi:TetR/AcrR family transcriptional regulator [Candidatus Dojkabacteria bacterium]|nr:TetR/AcrR family transcriptional regulator [Candidatus Dojkabacteria bacterium]
MRRRDKLRTKKEITNVAGEEFLKQGFLEASTIRIAERAEVAHGTIFFHFPTKADLIIACLYERLGKLAIKLDLRSRKTTNIRYLCRIFLDGIEKNSAFYSRLIKDLPLLPIEIQRMVFASLSAFSVHFVKVIKKAQDTGKVRKFQPKIAVFYLFGMVNYLYSYKQLLGTDKLRRKDKEEIIDFFINSLKK